MPFSYSLYDLSVRSDVPLPLASPPRVDPPGPDLVIRRIDSPPPLPAGPAVAQIDCPVHGQEMIEHRDATGIWVWLLDIGTFHIAPNAGQVDVYPDGQADDSVLGIALCGPIALLVRHLLGRPSLHASAVVVGGDAVAFLGPRGRGKSTMAASFLRRDGVLLTDDALTLLVCEDGIKAIPGAPFMKVWQETAQHTLELSEELPNLLADYEKKLLALDGRYAVADSPARLRTLYLLDRYDPAAHGRSDVTITTLRPREALVSLLANTSNRDYLLPGDDALALPLYARLVSQAPVRVLSYPAGFEHQERVCDQILQDLETS